MLSAGLLLGPLLDSAQRNPAIRQSRFGSWCRSAPAGSPTPACGSSRKHLGELGQQVIVENQPGAGGIIAANKVLKSEADGYTLAFLTNGTAISVPLFKKLLFDPLTDFTPVSTVSFFDFVLVTNASTVPRYGRGDGGARHRGRPQPGHHQRRQQPEPSAELLKSVTGANFAIVPYRQTPDLLVGTLRNDVDLMIDNYAAVKAAIDDGRARAIATTGAARSPALPDVPTVQESGIQSFEVTSWNGIFAPKGTPSEVIATMNRALQAVLAKPDVKQRMLDLGVEARASTPDELRARLQTDIAKWGEVIAKAGIEQQ